jgi:hypothetical protein
MPGHTEHRDLAHIVPIHGVHVQIVFDGQEMDEQQPLGPPEEGTPVGRLLSRPSSELTKVAALIK